MSLSARLLLPGDEARVDRFLEPHTPFAFFMRSNLRRGGLSYGGKPYQAEYFGCFEGDKLVGVLTHSWLSNVQLFVADNRFVPELAKALRDCRINHPREISAFLGEAAQVQALLSALGIPATALRGGEREEGLFSLLLGRMAIPALLAGSEVQVRRAQPKDIAQLASWRHDFYVEALGDPPGQKSYERALDEISRRVGEGDLFVLEDRGQLVSFCGVGGFLPDWKVVGPVWTPSDKRGLGYARAVTAGALRMAREEGATQAVLFTLNPQAERAYRAIGFDRIGDWRLNFLIDPVLQLSRTARSRPNPCEPRCS